MANNADKIKPHAWVKGKSGNPGGKAVGARNRLQGKFLHALADDFEAHGRQAIANAREADPLGYVRCIASLMPKQFEKSSPLEDLTDDELCAGIEFLKSRLSISVGEGVGETKVPQQARRLPALSEADGIPFGGAGLSGTIVDGRESVGQDSRGGHGNGHASDRGLP
jgi:hypothetical protein